MGQTHLMRGLGEAAIECPAIAREGTGAVGAQRGGCLGKAAPGMDRIHGGGRGHAGMSGIGAERQLSSGDATVVPRTLALTKRSVHVLPTVVAVVLDRPDAPAIISLALGGAVTLGEAPAVVVHSAAAC